MKIIFALKIKTFPNYSADNSLDSTELSISKLFEDE
jgi:hypothetical protein